MTTARCTACHKKYRLIDTTPYVVAKCPNCGNVDRVMPVQQMDALEIHEWFQRPVLGERLERHGEA